jgi:hypothetical protein
MAATPEAKVKAKVVAQLKELRAYYFYPVTGGFGASGLFDIVVCFRGLFIGIECKAGKGKPTALQIRNALQAKTAGAIVLLINEHNVADLGNTICKLAEGCDDGSESAERFSFWPTEGR